MSLVQMKDKMRKSMAPFVFAFVGIFILSIFLTFGFNGDGPGGAAQMAGGAFGRVGNATISNAEFAQYLDANQQQMVQFAQFGQPVTIQRQASLPDQAFQMLLRDYATARAAEQYGVRVSRSEAEASARQRIDEQLKQVGQGSTPQQIADIRQRMYASIDGEGERRRLLGQRLREKANQDAKPVEVKVAHVLIKTDKRTDAEALKLAQEVARQAKAGADIGQLASKYSEDAGSKAQGGVAGWASAQPDAAAPGKDGKPNPEAAQNFVQEFTAASLALQKGQVSDPVRSSYGYHVIKALDVRDFQPKIEPEPAPKKGDKKAAKPDPAKDAEKRQQALDSYKSQAANLIVEGLIGNQQKRMEGEVQANSAWLKGYLLEQKGNEADLPQVVAFYHEALKNAEPVATVTPQGFAYDLVELHRKLAKSYEDKKQKDKAEEQYREALKLLDRFARNDSEMLMARGDIQLKLGDKTKALESYQKALDRARRNPGVLAQLGDKFKEVGRKDLAAQASAKQAEQLAAEAEEQKRRQEEFQKMMAEQLKQQAEQKAKETSSAKPGAITVDPKTGSASKPITVKLGGTPGAPAGDAKKPDAKEAAPKQP